MAPNLAKSVEAVIVGTGPSALILSYILHGHIPKYNGTHHDPIVHGKISQQQDLLSVTPDLYDHFISSLRYSTQALPINTLLDTLLRPNADTENNPRSCITWDKCPDKYVSHLVLGNAPHPGGQWAEDIVSTKGDIGTLSYAEMLSLPGYSYSEHYLSRYGKPIPDFVRPSRIEVSDYYRAYPAAVGISGTIHNSVEVAGVSRLGSGFYIESVGIHCRYLVLATGIFSVNIPPPPLLAPLISLAEEREPLLVIGSGFSAADVIISAPPNRNILHIFQWSSDRPSPLKGCHHQAYPEYAGIYRQMKLAASSRNRNPSLATPFTQRRLDSFFKNRNWASVYHGLPNAQIVAVTPIEDRASVKIRLESGEHIEKIVGSFSYVVGRRGSLQYLSEGLRDEICSTEDATQISGRTLRAKAEMDLEVAPNVLIIGSLTGDSLVRHAFGGCVYAAGKIMGANHDTKSPASPKFKGDNSSIGVNGTAHQDLHLDRRKLARHKGPVI